MILRFFLQLALLMFFSCSLYVDNEAPNIFFEHTDFEILELGSSFSDMVITKNGGLIFLADYSNNRIIKISSESSMEIQDYSLVGSHPSAIDLNPQESKIAVALEGESKIKIVDINSLNIDKSFSIALMNVNDLIFINDSILVISSVTDPACITLNINSGNQQSQSVLNGELAVDKSRNVLYVATMSSIKKYNWDGENFSQDQNISDPYGFVGNINHFIYEPINNSVFICLSSNEENSNLQHVYSYDANSMTFSGKYLIKSAGLAVGVSEDGNRVFIAPTDADDIGVFVIEFDYETKLETNYYLSAGNLTRRGLLLHTGSSYIYTLVNIPGDDNSFEPYNNYLFDLQRIKI